MILGGVAMLWASSRFATKEDLSSLHEQFAEVRTWHAVEEAHWSALGDQLHSLHTMESDHESRLRKLEHHFD